MISTARLPPGRSLLLAVLVGVLLSGMVGMHHLAVGGGHAEVRAGADPVPVSAEHRPDPSGEGDHDAGTALLHLCLAVLAAVAVAVVALALWRRPVPPGGPATRAGSRCVSTRPRAPPRGAPARLALLCVLRT